MSDILLRVIVVSSFRPGIRDLSEENMSTSTQVITSMYLRREKEKTMKVGRFTPCLLISLTLVLFEDCYEYPAKRSLACSGKSLFHSPKFTNYFCFQKLSTCLDSSDEHCEKNGGVLCSVQTSTTSTIYESCYSHNSYTEDEFPSATSSPLSSSDGTTYVLLITCFDYFSSNLTKN